MARGLLRYLSLFLILCLSAEQTGYAAPDLKPFNWNPDSRKDLAWARSVVSDLPASVATIEDAWKAEGGGTKDEGRRTLILIQDAHTNNSAQFNIAKTLEILSHNPSLPQAQHSSSLPKAPQHSSSLRGAKRRSNLDFNPESKIASSSAEERRTPRNDGTPLVFVEAGFEDESLTFLKQFGTQEERKQAAESLLRQGKLQGSEYFNLTTDKDVILWGVEDLNLYKEALETYRSVAKKRDKYEDYLQRIQTTINTLKPRIYNPHLLSFDQKNQDFKKENLSLTDYFELLTSDRKSTRLNSSH